MSGPKGGLAGCKGVGSSAQPSQQATEPSLHAHRQAAAAAQGHVRQVKALTLERMPSFSHMFHSSFLLSFMQASMMVLMGSYTNWQKPRLHLSLLVCFFVHLQEQQLLSRHR